IHAGELAGGLRTTQPALEAALGEALSWDEVPDLEVETYTWNVLPAAAAGGFELAAGIAEEMLWALDRIEAAGFSRGAGGGRSVSGGPAAGRGRCPAAGSRSRS